MKTDHDLERQLRDALRQTLDREVGPDPSWVASRAARVVGTPRRRPRWTLRVLMVAALLAVGGGAAVLLGPGPDNLPAQLGTPHNGWIAYTVRVDWTPDADTDLWLVAPDQEARRAVGSETDDTQQMCPAFSPDGRHLAYGRVAGGGDTDAVVADVTENGIVTDALTVETPMTGSVPCSVWSPDGSHLAFGVNQTSPVNPSRSAESSDVWIVRVADGQVTVLPHLLATDLEFSPDGQLLAVASGVNQISYGNRLQDGRISLYDLGSGSTRLLDSTLGAGSLSWAPDGRRIAYIVDDNNTIETQLRLVDVETDTHEVLDEGFYLLHGIGPVWSPDGRSIVYQRGTSGERHEVVLLNPDAPEEQAVPEVVAKTYDLPGLGDGWGLYPYRVTWSPDGAYLLMTAWANPGGGGGYVDPILVAISLNRDLPNVVLSQDHGLVPYEAYDNTTFVPIQAWGRATDD